MQISPQPIDVPTLRRAFEANDARSIARFIDIRNGEGVRCAVLDLSRIAGKDRVYRTPFVGMTDEMVREGMAFSLLKHLSTDVLADLKKAARHDEYGAYGENNPPVTMRSASLGEIREMAGRGEIKAPDATAPARDMPQGFWGDARLRPIEGEGPGHIGEAGE